MDQPQDQADRAPLAEGADPEPSAAQPVERGNPCPSAAEERIAFGGSTSRVRQPCAPESALPFAMGSRSPSFRIVGGARGGQDQVGAPWSIST